MMGIAAYNRGTRAISAQIDQELAARKRVVYTLQTNLPKHGPAAKHQCERCIGPLGVRLDRTCSWDEQYRRWWDCCFDCKRVVNRESSEFRRGVSR